MRILFVSASNNNGGASKALLNIVAFMIGKGHDVHVVTDTRPDFLLTELRKINDCKLHLMPLSLNIKISSGVKNPVTYVNYYISLFIYLIRQKIKLKKLILSIKPDVVHTNVGPFTTAAKICKDVGIPHVWHIREYQKEFGFRMFPSYTSFLNLISDSNNYNIAITKGIFKHFNLKTNKDCVIYDGVYFENELKRKCIESKDNYLLFVGRVMDTKGVYELLAAFSSFHLRYPHVFLKIAGDYSLDDSFYRKCNDLIIEKSIEGCVEFLGRREDIYDLMSHARCLIVPSKMEGFGFITVEAMLNYCPVIGRDCFGTKEQFDNGLQWTGKEIAYRYNTIGELIHYLEDIMTSNTNEMVERAHRAIEQYSIENSATQLENLYCSICKLNE